MPETLEVLTVLNLPGVGRETTHLLFPLLAEEPWTADRIREKITQIKTRYRGVKVPRVEDVEAAHKRAAVIMEKCANEGIEILLSGSEDFPKNLTKIPHAPVLLYVKGDKESLYQDYSVAVVGTREPSPYGRRAAERLGTVFAERGWTVVSGLARGCDTKAHWASIHAGGRTVAFLAHGLDRVFPAENEDLAEKIIETGGCLASEYPPGTEPEKYRFRERDRLQSGLSRGVIAVETDLAGGTIHTMNYCLAQKKVLACLRHIEKYRTIPQAEGNREYLSSGMALPVEDEPTLNAFIEAMINPAVPADL